MDLFVIWTLSNSRRFNLKYFFILPFVQDHSPEMKEVIHMSPEYNDELTKDRERI